MLIGLLGLMVLLAACGGADEQANEGTVPEEASPGLAQTQEQCPDGTKPFTIVVVPGTQETEQGCGNRAEGPESCLSGFEFLGNERPEYPICFAPFGDDPPPPPPDRDGDGVADDRDNCPNDVNPKGERCTGQEDVDGDGIGDVCDPVDDRPPPTPEQPQTKDDCKDDGYTVYGSENQGQCIKATK